MDEGCDLDCLLKEGRSSRMGWENRSWEQSAVLMAGQAGWRELSSMKLLPGVLGWERVGRSLPGAPVSVQASIGLPGARALSLCKSVPRPANRRLWHRRT